MVKQWNSSRFICIRCFFSFFKNWDQLGISGLGRGEGQPDCRLGLAIQNIFLAIQGKLLIDIFIACSISICVLSNLRIFHFHWKRRQACWLHCRPKHSTFGSCLKSTLIQNEDMMTSPKSILISHGCITPWKVLSFRTFQQISTYSGTGSYFLSDSDLVYTNLPDQKCIWKYF